MINFLIIGDVIGRPGRNFLTEGLSILRSQKKIDALLVNGENLAGGFGITRKTYSYLVDKLGVDVITLGNHWHDKPEVEDLVELEGSRLVVPYNAKNIKDNTKPGIGYKVFKTGDGISYVVMNILGKVFMNPETRSPFESVDKMFEDPQVQNNPIRLLDVHAEATSEKQGIGFHYAPVCSVIYGTHSHVPTSDERILEDHAGFITDIGMTGGYDSVIGMKKSKALERMIAGTHNKLEPSKKDGWLCALYCSVEEDGRCSGIERIQLRMPSKE